jgi:catechol 2,3-dioxygenase-like lactoylglutathione lyase family enzyme
MPIPNRPAARLDHVVINVRDRMDEAVSAYERLGFRLTPRGHHTLGSINHLAVFGSDYLELVGFPPGAGHTRPELRDAPVGMNGIVFQSPDADALYAELASRGVPAEPPLEFSRPVSLASGAEDARFRTLRLKPEAVNYGRVYFCQHLTPQLVWRDEWRGHANGATGVARAVVAAADPQRQAEIYARIFGAAAVRAVAGGAAVKAGGAEIELLGERALRDRYGSMAPEAGGRTDYMAALAFRTASLEQAQAALARNGVKLHRESKALAVPADAAMNVTLEFVE